MTYDPVAKTDTPTDWKALWISLHPRLGRDFFEHVGEKHRVDKKRFLGYVCQIAKVRVRMSFGWVSLFAQKFVYFDFFVRMRI